MMVGSRIFLIVVNVYDGLFKGGLLLIASEVTAELGYPRSEAISLGLINAM